MHHVLAQGDRALRVVSRTHHRRFPMTLIGLLVLLVVIGVALYLVGLIPMDATIRRVIQVVVLLAVVLWLLEALGVLGALNVPIGHAHVRVR
jgi:uncharacterized protein YqhQ